MLMLFLCPGAAPRVVRARGWIFAIRGEGGGGNWHAAPSGQSHIQADPAPLHSISISLLLQPTFSLTY